MRVIDIINAADPAKVEAEYCRAYPFEDSQADWAKSETFRRYRQTVNDAIGVVDEPMTVLIRRVLGDEGDERYDVSGRPIAGDELHALEFTPWGEWKLMEVEFPGDLDLHQAACHLYFEMTWCGWPEQIIQRRDEIFDLKEQVLRDVAMKE